MANLQVNQQHAHVDSPPESLQNCRNCDASVTGPYCQSCGQRHESLLHPFRQLLGEVVSTVLNLDARFYQTFKMLAKPGRLTTAYLNGQRVRFITPFRLYLSFSIIYFALTTWLNVSDFLFFTIGDDAEELDGLVQALPRAMFVLVPAFALLMKGLYRKPLYAAHLVFSLHVHALWFIVFSIVLVTNATATYVHGITNWSWIALITKGVDFIEEWSVFIYLYLAMRYVYKSSWIMTFVKMILLLLGYVTVLTLILLAYLFVTMGPNFLNEL